MTIKTVVQFGESDACDLIAEALKARAKDRRVKYLVRIKVTPGYAGGPLDSSPAMATFEATEVAEAG